MFWTFAVPQTFILSIKFIFGILQIDQSVLEALPPDIREQVEQVYAAQQGEPRGSKKKEPVNGCSSGVLPHPVGTVLLQIPEPQEPNNSDTRISVIALPAFSQVRSCQGLLPSPVLSSHFSPGACSSAVAGHLTLFIK